MKELSAETLNDIVLLHDGSAWAEVIDVTLPSGFVPTAEFADIVALYTTDMSRHILITNAGKDVRDNTDLNWTTPNREIGKVYLCTPYKREAQSEMQGTDGAQTMNVSFGDTSGRLWEMSKSLNGFRGLSVSIAMAQVKSETGAEFEIYPPELSVEYTVRYSSTDRTNFSFFLSTSAPFGRQYPQRRMFKAQCRWVFKSPECGYAGNISTCPRTIAGCKARGNITRIGCFPGCGSGGLAQ